MNIKLLLAVLASIALCFILIGVLSIRLILGKADEAFALVKQDLVSGNYEQEFGAISSAARPRWGRFQMQSDAEGTHGTMEIILASDKYTGRVSGAWALYRDGKYHFHSLLDSNGVELLGR